MKVLVACEFSGTVRDAFIRAGHDAWSCDILPSESPGPHFHKDALEVLSYGWDLLIAHPPCRYLSYAGMAHWNAPGRAELREQAAMFFLAFWRAKIHRIAIENPKGWISRRLHPPTQYIEPFEHGHAERKKTGLWLKNLPRLRPSARVKPPGPRFVDRSGKNRYFTDAQPGGTKQAHARSRTFKGIAEAMAAQWGDPNTFPEFREQSTFEFQSPTE